MVADIALADELLHVRVLECLVHIFVDTRQHNLYTLALRRLDEYFKIVDGCRVDKRHFTHTDDAHRGLF